MSINLLHIILRIQGFFSRKMHVSKPETVSFLDFVILPEPIVDLGGGGEGV